MLFMLTCNRSVILLKSVNKYLKVSRFSFLIWYIFIEITSFFFKLLKVLNNFQA